MSRPTSLEERDTPHVNPEKAAIAISNAPGEGELIRVAALFRLLGDATRARLLYSLLEAGELCVSDLAAVTDTPEATVSQALRLMRTAGIVTGRRSGRNVFYRLSDAHVRLLLDVTREHVLHDAKTRDQGRSLP